MKKERFSIPLIGVSSLIVIFAAISLAVFAVLSLNTALSGQRLSLKNADTAIEYYKADTYAHEILSLIRAGEIPSGVHQKGNEFSYSCYVSEGMELYVSVTVDSNGNYEINNWQVCRTGNWTPDDSINVWDGN